jgi:hypothetical protein|tara:strand:- start:51 stop:1559 length:1509 start_codon:yes stop_codon:yes gene_type:complete
MGLGNIAIVQSPNSTTGSKVPVITNWTPMIGYMIHQDDISGLYFFKLVMDVRLVDASGDLIARIKQRRNSYSPDVSAEEARAFFDLRDIINSQMVDTVFDQNQNGVPFESIHTLGSNTGFTSKIFSVNGDSRIGKTQVQTIYIKAYQEFSDGEAVIPTYNTTENVTNIKTYIPASLPLFTQRSVVGGTVDSSYIQGDEFQPYQCNSDTDQFLSDVGITTDPTYGITGYINYVRWNDETDVGDYHTVGFLNNGGDWESEVDRMYIQYYNKNGTPLGSDYVINYSVTGGASPSTANTDTDYLLYFGCGPGNLEAQTASGFTVARPSSASNMNWAYYKIWGADASAPNPAKTAEYYFIKEGSSCKGFKIRRLAWRNSLGCYDYFNFRMKSTQTIEVTRNNYNSILGRFNASKWYYNNTMRGKKTRQVTAVLKETLNTDWLTEDQAYLMEKLIMSTDVYIVKNEDTEFTQGVMIVDKSIIKKTKANNKLIQYTIKIEYANPVNTNS